MAVPSQGTVAVGDKITASLWNDDVRDAVDFLISPPQCKLRKSVTQVIPNAVYTAITWDTEVYDTDTMHDNVIKNAVVKLLLDDGLADPSIDDNYAISGGFLSRVWKISRIRRICF